MPTYPVPLHAWPRSEADLKNADKRLGGRTFYMFGPLVDRVVKEDDGTNRTVKRPSFARFCVEAEAEPAVAQTATRPSDDRLVSFLRAVAQSSARRWAEEAQTDVDAEATR